jgi:hypothetical protein
MMKEAARILLEKEIRKNRAPVTHTPISSTFDLCYANQIRPNFVEKKLHVLQINLERKLCTQFEF